jgi:hypothetical protein
MRLAYKELMTAGQSMAELDKLKQPVLHIRTEIYGRDLYDGIEDQNLPVILKFRVMSSRNFEITGRFWSSMPSYRSRP